MGDRLACVVLPCLSLWYEPSWGVDYAMCKNVSDVSVDVSDVSEVLITKWRLAQGCIEI